MEKELTVTQALNLAVEKHNKGKLTEAEIIYKKILEKNPNQPDALHLWGVIHHQRRDYVKAKYLIERAIEINPNPAVYYGNLGMVLEALKNEEESIKNFNRALERDSSYEGAHLAHYNLGVYFNDRGKFEEALKHYDSAISLKKNFYDAYWNRGLILLLLGRFKEGLKDYEYRFKKKSPTDSRIFNKEKWDGSSLKGKKILIVSEQGYGDSILFIRYLPLVKEKGGYVIFECKKELIKLFEGFSGIDEIVEKDKFKVPDLDFDSYIHIMSLPMLFEANLSNIPNKIPYLKTEVDLVMKFKEKLNFDDFKVGIVWSGNPKFTDNKQKSVPFKMFNRLKKIPRVKLISLQKGEPSEHLDDFEIVDITSKINDFSDTAAIIENLDLVISVDTSVAHLAGALGKTTWTLLSFIPDWRWFLDSKDCPWYPNMRLFRQPSLGDWRSVFMEVEKELRVLLRNKSIE